MTKNKNEPFVRDGSLCIRADEEENARRVELSLSSEEPCQRWFGPEILLHEPDAIDLSRLQEIGVVLFNHNPDKILGKVASITLDEESRKLRATMIFDDDPEAEIIYQKVRSGTLKGVSVGYQVDVWEEVEEGEMSTNGRFQGPCSIATKWTPYEFSIVSVPADASVGVGRNMDVFENPKEEDYKMDEKKTKNIETPVVDVEAERSEAVKLERARVSEITAMCKTFERDADAYIKKGMSVEEARAAIMAELANERAAIKTNTTVLVDESEKIRAAAADGLAMRAGIVVAKPADGAEQFRGKSLLRLAGELVERGGVNINHMSDEQILRAAMTGSGAFPGILSNVANKSMAQAYQAAQTTYQLWTASGSNRDFKINTRYRLSEGESLEEIKENGEFKHAEFSEGDATTVVKTYGKAFSLTRQAIINDDLSALSSIPTKMALAARRGINEAVYALLTENAKVEGSALFSEKHNNLAAVALDVAGLGALKAAMARQTNIAGKEKLNIQPAFLIVPPELEVQAAQLINSVVDPSKANATVNPFANKLQVISDPELTDAKTFYMVAAPGFAPTIEVTYLNGNDAPTLESAVQFDTLGIKYRIYMDYGVNLLDFRGIQRSTISE